ncbi:mannose-1-phosphate guanylyltransferase/mannose-6-phosphate isomerase [Zavarzinia sp.]|uniref:mannose-1-phosphate guanylyltransferase/mannose-6-phosphate isomerase n=1 Tax=Zavarzinia sp. TaxID=2027920 RepID=UPI00356A804A
MSVLVPVVLCGGSGSRLWPASRSSYPKQFLDLGNNRSMFQQAVARVAGLGKPIVVANSAYRFVIADQLRQVAVEADILLEPAARDSCPAIAAAAFKALSDHEDPVLMVVAADHAITDSATFSADVLTAAEAARQDFIVCFGLKPTELATGYGYIRPGAPMACGTVLKVDAFVEKPDRETAERYVTDGLLWNSGNFAFRASTFLAELAKFEPAVVEQVEKATATSTEDLGFIALDGESFKAAPKISVDYAVLERTDMAVVLPARFDWSDVGTWAALHQAMAKDENGCAAIGDGVFADAKDSLVYSPNHLTVVAGLDDVVVAHTRDATLVMSRSYAEKLKQVVSGLESSRRSEATEHRLVHRPWGTYEGIDSGERHQVKRITLKPGAKISLQSHLHRSEHWIIVKGTAQVVLDDKVRILTENQSIYIPLGSHHRLENPGRIQLELIEVQTGSYLGEDDIIRYENIYKRG